MTEFNTLSPLTHPLLDLPGIKHGFFTRKGGVSGGIYASLNIGRGSKDVPADVAENRRRVAQWFGKQDSALSTCFQIHSTRVHYATEPFGEARPEGDGVYTKTPGIICGALAADCTQVLMADPETRLIGAVHAGWRGALDGALEALADGLVSKGAQKSNLRAVIGPCIGPNSYEVSTDYQAIFLAQDPDSAPFFEPGQSQDKRMFNLPGYALMRLRRHGIEQSDAMMRDTCAEEDLFFSNRRAYLRGESDYGRLVSAIMLVD